MENDIMKYDETETYVEEAEPMKLTQKIKWIFLSPTKVFKNIKDHPKIIGPLILCCVLSIIIVFLQTQTLGRYYDELNSIFLERYGTGYPNYDTIQSAQNDMTSKIIGSISSIFVTLISWVISSIFLWLFSKIVKGKAKLNEVLSVNVHAMMISYILLAIIMPINILLNSYVGIFSLAIVIPNLDHTSILHNILRLITLPDLWATYVLGLGLSIVSNFKQNKGITISFIIYMITVILGAMSLTSVFWIFDMLSKQGQF